MACKFTHLPYDITSFILTKPPNILINSENCPKQQTRPCKKAGSCCLGLKKCCRKAPECLNNSKERTVELCKDTLENVATAGR